jgi:surfactin synthase thioesterase subunit
MYHAWKDVLPAWINPIALELPGHCVRHKQAAACDWDVLMDVLSDEIRPHLDRPFGIFGHSMGALVGLELAHAVHARFQRMAAWLCASGCVAPSRREPEHNWLDCSPGKVVERLRKLGGTPFEVLDNRELLDVLLPMLRADFHLCGTYRLRPRQPLSSALLILGGTRDDVSHPLENLSAWSVETTGTARMEMIDGGHFFIDTSRDAVTRLVATEVASTARQKKGPHFPGLRPREAWRW